MTNPNNARTEPFTRRVKVRAMVIAGQNDYVVHGASAVDDKSVFEFLKQHAYYFNPVDEGIVIVEFEVDVIIQPINIVKLDASNDPLQAG